MLDNLLILVLLGILLVIYAFFRSIMAMGLRVAFMQTFLVFSVLVWLSTELMSCVSLLTETGMRGMYILVLSAGLGILKCLKVPILSILKEDFSTLQRELPQYFVGSYRYLLYLFLGVTLFLAIYVAPNNTDALGYHIARVMFWAQNHDLGHYPTEFSPQLYYNVLSEYFFLHLYLLTGSDYFFNVVQWASMLVILLASSKLLQIWGQSKPIQGLGLLFTFVIPQLILQSTSSQNDLLSASYFLMSVLWGFQLIQNQFSTRDYGWGLLAFLLGGFTKYSIFVIGFPMIAFFGIFQLYVNPLRAVKLGTIAILFFGLIFGLFFARNYQLMGQPIAPALGSPLFIGSYTSELMNGQTFISNWVKIMGNHLALPFGFWNLGYDHWVHFVHQLIHFPVNSKLNSFDPYLTSFSIGEDFSGNFLHFLGVVALFLFLLFRIKSSWKSPHVYLFALLCLGFCVYVEIFKWQRFHARTQMAFFVSTAPLVIYFLAQNWKLTQTKINILAWLFLLQGIPFVFFNSIKPLVPLSYWVKKGTHYLPNAIAAQQDSVGLVDQLLERKIYQRGATDQLVKRSDLSPEEVKVGFGILDRMGVFNQDKRWIGSLDERNAHYVLYNSVRYEELNAIFTLIGKQRKHIGFHSYSSFVSPFFMMGKSYLGNDFRMQYIRYPSIFQGKFHTSPAYFYEVILTDDDAFVKSLPPQIGQIVRMKTWTVILLAKPTNKVYLLS